MTLAKACNDIGIEHSRGQFVIDLLVSGVDLECGGAQLYLSVLDPCKDYHQRPRHSQFPVAQEGGRWCFRVWVVFECGLFSSVGCFRVWVVFECGLLTRLDAFEGLLGRSGGGAMPWDFAFDVVI